jgi:hypothetical protein
VEPKGDRDGVHAEAQAAPSSRRIAIPPAHEPTPVPSQSHHSPVASEEVSSLIADKDLATPARVQTRIRNLHAEKEPKIVEKTIERIDRVEKHTTVQAHETVRMAAKPEQQKSNDAPVLRGATTSREPANPILSSSPQTLPMPGLNAAAPEIHISIGRVIVNSRPASVPRPQAAAAAPTIRLTLDQYLRQRGGRP